MEKHPHANWQLLAVLLGAPAVSYSSLLFRAKLSALPPWFAEISPEPAAAAPPQNPNLLPATPQPEPGKRGPKTKAYKAAQTTYDITSFFAATSSRQTNAPPFQVSASPAEEGGDERPKPEVSSSETRPSVAEPEPTTTAPAKKPGGFHTGTKLCPGVNCEPHLVRAASIIIALRIRASSPQPCAGRWARHRLLCFGKWTRPTATRRGESSERASHRCSQSRRLRCDCACAARRARSFEAHRGHVRESAT